MTLGASPDTRACRGGFNVFRRVVEDALLEHPDVASAGVVAGPIGVCGRKSWRCLPHDRQHGGGRRSWSTQSRAGAYKYSKEVHILDLVPLTPVGKSTARRCENGCLDNHYPGGEGLVTSPGRRARLSFHSPVLRVRRRRCGLA
jgi:non-ribosomal peptide synthetase component E (peptide arylation enzyme)